MSAVDHLRRAREEMAAYRQASPCGLCREDADAVIDMLDKDIDFETLMREYIARHPRAAEVPARSAEVGRARDEVSRRLGGGGPAAAREPVIGSLARTARTWREDLSGLVPRPFGIRPEPRRER